MHFKHMDISINISTYTCTVQLHRHMHVLRFIHVLLVLQQDFAFQGRFRAQLTSGRCSSFSLTGLERERARERERERESDRDRETETDTEGERRQCCGHPKPERTLGM